jgi:hypothetical protein
MRAKLEQIAKMLGYEKMEDFYFYFAFCGVIPLAAIIYLLLKLFIP